LTGPSLILDRQSAIFTLEIVGFGVQSATFALKFDCFGLQSATFALKFDGFGPQSATFALQSFNFVHRSRLGPIQVCSGPHFGTPKVVFPEPRPLRLAAR